MIAPSKAGQARRHRCRCSGSAIASAISAIELSEQELASLQPASSHVSVFDSSKFNCRTIKYYIRVNNLFTWFHFPLESQGSLMFYDFRRIASSGDCRPIGRWQYWYAPVRHSYEPLSTIWKGSRIFCNNDWHDRGDIVMGRLSLSVLLVDT